MQANLPPAPQLMLTKMEESRSPPEKRGEGVVGRPERRALEMQLWNRCRKRVVGDYLFT